MDITEERGQTRVLAIIISSILVVVPQYYLAVEQPRLDWTVFVFAVAVPVLVGSALFRTVTRRKLLFLFLAYIPSVTDDSPVNLDSFYTWPEVTTGFHHIITEVLLHALTALFLFLSVREAFKGSWKKTTWKFSAVWLLTLAAFGAASVSIIPLPSLQAAISTSWFQIDAIGHVMSLGLMYTAIREAAKG
jgi:hypothetical protein